MRKSVEQMIEDLIDREGPFVDHPADRGGPTCWGWTEESARSEGYAGAMKDMPRSWAAAAYNRKYFIRPGFNQVYMLSQPIAEELFDTAVNMGLSIPAPWLQRWLNAMNRIGKIYPDISIDGRIGPATIGALRSFLHARGAEGEKVMLRGLNSLQGARYLELTEKRELNETFLYGWILSRIEVS